jgi:hypothetical protein
VHGDSPTDGPQHNLLNLHNSVPIPGDIGAPVHSAGTDPPPEVVRAVQVVSHRRGRGSLAAQPWAPADLQVVRPDAVQTSRSAIVDHRPRMAAVHDHVEVRSAIREGRKPPMPLPRLRT